MTAMWFQKIFNVLSPLSTLLQTRDLDLLAGVNSINDAKKSIQKLRKNDSIMEYLTNEVNIFIKENDSFEFSEFKTTRIRKKKRMSNEENVDECIQDPIEKFKVETVLGSLDVILSNLDQYFNDTTIGVMKDMALFSKKRIIEIKKNPNSLPDESFAVFCEVYGTFVEQETLKSELLKFCNVYELFENTTFLPEHFYISDKSETESICSFEEETDQEQELELPKRKQINPINISSMKTIFNVFQNGSLGNTFPSLDAAMRISLTIPLSSASTERSFSKLKIIKSRLRTTMSQARLEDLMVISCEQDIVDKMDHEEIVHKFAANSITLTKYLI